MKRITNKVRKTFATFCLDFRNFSDFCIFQYRLLRLFRLSPFMFRFQPFANLYPDFRDFPPQTVTTLCPDVCTFPDSGVKIYHFVVLSSLWSQNSLRNFHVAKSGKGSSDYAATCRIAPVALLPELSCLHLGGEGYDGFLRR